MKTLETSNRIALQNVLFATDFSPFSENALPYAVAIAKQYDGKVFAVHAVSASAFNKVPAATWPVAIDDESKHDQWQVDRLNQELAGVPHEVLMKVGDVWQVLSKLIKQAGIDLLVLGTHGRTGMSKILMGSVAEEIFRQAQCPVLTVGPEVRARNAEAVRFKKILFATDFSDASKAGLRYAFSLAEENQATISLLHCIEEPETGSVDLDANAAFIKRQLEELVPNDARNWCNTRCFVEYGEHAEAILAFAKKEHFDLIVMGVRAATGSPEMATHLANRTAHTIVAHAACPVLTVRG